MAENDYTDLIEQLNRDKATMKKLIAEMDLQIQNFETRKHLTQGAIQYVDQFLSRFDQ